MPGVRSAVGDVSSTSWLRLLVAALAAAGATGLPTVSSAQGGAPDDDRRAAVDLKIAVREGTICGELGDSLPTLVATSGMQPGDRTPPVVVCAVNRGASPARLTLSAVERVETDVACSGDEAAFDTTCGPGLGGELGGSLLVHIATQPSCKGPFGASTPTAFAALATAPAAVAAEMRRNRLLCISLALEHRPSSEDAATAAQSDSVSWRYAFDIST